MSGTARGLMIISEGAEFIGEVRNCTRLEVSGTIEGRLTADTIVVQRDNAMPDADIAAVMTPGDEDWPAIAAGRSDDGSLKWEAHGDPKSNAHSFAVYRWGGTGYLLDRIEVNRR